jgi:hypothetical protein
MGFSNIIVVDNLPVVPPEKYEKVENVVRKIYSQIGVIKEGVFGCLRTQRRRRHTATASSSIIPPGILLLVSCVYFS